MQFNQHLTHRGDVVFEHACKMGLEGIVSKRLGSCYRSGRTSDWLKFKNSGGAGGEARGGRRLGQGRMAVTPDQCRWFIVPSLAGLLRSSGLG